MRPEATRFIEYSDAFHQFDSDRVAIAADDPLWAPAGQKSDALVARDIEFLAALRRFHRRHLGLRLKTRDRNLERTAPHRLARRVERDAHRAGRDALLFLLGHDESGHEGTNRGSGRIDRDQAAADHDHLAAQRNAVAAIDIEQVVDRLDHSVGITTLDRHCAATRRANGEKNSFVAQLFQFSNSEPGSKRRFVAKGDA